MKNEILNKRLDILEKVKGFDIDSVETINFYKNNFTTKELKEMLLDKYSDINLELRIVKGMVEEMGDEYISDEAIIPVLDAKIILNKYENVKNSLIDYVL